VREHGQELLLAAIGLRELLEPCLEFGLEGLLNLLPLRNLGFESARLLLQVGDEAKALVRAEQRRVALGGNAPRIGGANREERAAVRSSGKAAGRVGTKEGEGMLLGKLIPHLFGSDGGALVSGCK